MMKRLLGALVFSVLGIGAAAVVTWLINPWFLDEPLSFLLLVVVPFMLVGVLLGPRLPSLGRPEWWFLASCTLFVSAVFRPLPAQVGTQLMVVGIDGATWPVVERVETPHLDALVERGSSGRLVGEEPLFSPLLWSTLATGRRPEAHGIQGVRTRTDQAQVARFWEVARHAGMSVGLYKWLVTWPPPTGDVAGFTVPAWLAGDAQTHPSSLSWVKELELSRRTKRKQIAATRPLNELVRDAIFGGIRWSTIRTAMHVLTFNAVGAMSPADRERRLRHVRLRIDRDCFVFQLHRHQPNLATFTIYLTDAISHTHWSVNGGQHVDEAYRLADDVLGDLVAQLKPQADVLVISDHGFRDAGAGHATHSAVPMIDALKTWLEPQIGEVQIVRVGRQLVLTPDEVVTEEVLQSVVSKLQLATGEEMYALDALPHGSAWSLKLKHLPAAAAWGNLRVAGMELTDLVRAGPPESGEHDPSGIVVLAGSDSKRSNWYEVAQVDIAPTILALLRLPVAEDMEGTALVEERVPRVLSHNQLAPKQSAAKGTTNEDRLKKLGYID